MYLVSACLVGVECRYDGKSVIDRDLEKLMKSGRVIPVCPEVLGGLPIPRVPCEIVITEHNERKVINEEGKDCTSHFMEGARKTLEICKAANIDTAILKARSPSCGCSQIYDGTFTGKLKDGKGLTAELLMQNGIKVFSEESRQRIDND